MIYLSFLPFGVVHPRSPVLTEGLRAQSCQGLNQEGELEEDRFTFITFLLLLVLLILLLLLDELLPKLILSFGILLSFKVEVTKLKPFFQSLRIVFHVLSKVFELASEHTSHHVLL